MGRRARGSIVSPPQRNDVQGSTFDTAADPVATISFPRSVSAVRRERARKVIRTNPYLGQAQLASVLRYTDLVHRYEELVAEAADIPYTYETERGDVKPSPIYDMLAKTQTLLLTQERHLAISVPTRNEQVTKKDQAPAAPAKGARAKNGAPTLRLA